MATNDSSAFPCFIEIAPSTTGYNIDGRGKGDRQAANAAMDELGALSVADFQTMIAETPAASEAQVTTAIGVDN